MMENVLINRNLPKDKYLYMNHYFVFSMEGRTLSVTHKDLNSDLTEVIKKEIECDIKDIDKFIDTITSVIDEIARKISVIYELSNGGDDCIFKKKLYKYVIRNTYNNFIFAHNCKGDDDTPIQNIITMNKGVFEKWGIAPSVKIDVPIMTSNKLIEAYLSIYPLRPVNINKALIYIKYNDNIHTAEYQDILEIMYDNNNSYKLAVNILEYIDTQIDDINQYDVFNNIKKVNAYLDEVNKLLISYALPNYVVMLPYPNQWQPVRYEQKINGIPTNPPVGNVTYPPMPGNTKPMNQ